MSFPPRVSVGFLVVVCARKGSLCLAPKASRVIRPPAFHSPKQGGRDASSLGNLCIQRGSGKETSGLFYCLMEITWHLSKRSVPAGSLLLQAVIKEKLWSSLGVLLSGFRTHKILRPGLALECCNKSPNQVQAAMIIAHWAFSVQTHTAYRG